MKRNEVTSSSVESPQRKKKSSLAKADDSIAKTVNQATGLVAYDLQAPSKNLYPVNTPIRNVLPRIGGGVGPATNWVAVNAINGSGLAELGWVIEHRHCVSDRADHEDREEQLHEHG